MRKTLLIKECIIKIVIWITAILVLSFLLIIIGYVLKNGLSHLNFAFFFNNPKRLGKEGGIASIILSTFYLTTLAIMFALPIGVGTALFQSEYIKESVKKKILTFLTETLAGIPSIIFGLFGFAFFVTWLKLGFSLLAGSLTLAVMILPTIIKTTEETLKAVPKSYKEASLALGATKKQTILRVLLPTALPGIITGLILALGRVIGETAALLLTAGSSAKTPTSFLASGRSLAVHLYILATEGISLEMSFATASVLIFLVLIINSLANWLQKKLPKKLA